MSILDLIILGIGEAMDAGAVSMAKGTTTRRPTLHQYLSVGLWFGAFQALMTLIGYFIGARFINLVESFDHWISFILLSLIGLSMIKEALSKKSEHVGAGYSAKTMLILAVATSMDALAVGVSLGFISVNVWLAALVIGVVTFLLSVLGLKIGNIFGNRFKSSAELTGGIVLILIGTKILLSHIL